MTEARLVTKEQLAAALHATQVAPRSCGPDSRGCREAHRQDARDIFAALPAAAPAERIGSDIYRAPFLHPEDYGYEDDSGHIPPSTEAAAPAEGLAEPIMALKAWIEDTASNDKMGPCSLCGGKQKHLPTCPSQAVIQLWHRSGLAVGYHTAKPAAPAEGLPWTLLRALVEDGGNVTGAGFAGTDYTTGRRKWALFPDESVVLDARAALARHESAGSEK